MDAVKLVALQGEYHPRCIVLFIGVLQVSGLSQNFQGTVYLDGEVLEITAELIDVEGIGTAQAISHCHLVIVVDVFVYFQNVFLRGEGIRDPFLQGSLVAAGIQ